MELKDSFYIVDFINFAKTNILIKLQYCTSRGKEIFNKLLSSGFTKDIQWALFASASTIF